MCFEFRKYQIYRVLVPFYRHWFINEVSGCELWIWSVSLVFERTRCHLFWLFSCSIYCTLCVSPFKPTQTYISQRISSSNRWFIIERIFLVNYRLCSNSIILLIFLSAIYNNFKFRLLFPRRFHQIGKPWWLFTSTNLKTMYFSHLILIKHRLSNITNFLYTSVIILF